MKAAFRNLMIVCTGCILLAPTPIHAAAKIKLTWWDPYGPPYSKVMEKIIVDFNASRNDIVVKRQSSSYPGYVEKMALAMMAGKGPDMAHVWDSSSACQLWAMGLTRSMDEYMVRDKAFWSQVYPAFMEGLKFRGKQLGLLDSIGASMLYWRKDFFSEAGLDPDRAPTFDELELYAAKLTKKRDGGKYDVMGFNPTDTWSGFRQWVSLFGGQIFDKKTEKVTANTEANLKALTWLTDFARKYGGIANLSSKGGFEGGQVAMLVGQPYIMKNIVATKKNLNFNIGLPPTPGGPDAGGGPIAGADCDIVLRSSKNPDAAYQFLKYFTARGGFMQQDTPDAAALPSVNADFHPPTTVVPKGLWMPVVVKALTCARPGLTMPGADKYVADLDRLVYAAYLGKKSPQQALTEAQQLGEKHLNEAMKRARWGK